LSTQYRGYKRFGNDIHLKYRVKDRAAICLQPAGKCLVAASAIEGQMAVAATFIPASVVLSVSDDSLDNTITTSRHAAGNLLVDGGAVAISDGIATVANTSLSRFSDRPERM
jgi:hypothetical protein